MTLLFPFCRHGNKAPRRVKEAPDPTVLVEGLGLELGCWHQSLGCILLGELRKPLRSVTDRGQPSAQEMCPGHHLTAIYTEGQGS